MRCVYLRCVAYSCKSSLLHKGGIKLMEGNNFKNGTKKSAKKNLQKHFRKVPDNVVNNLYI